MRAALTQNAFVRLGGDPPLPTAAPSQPTYLSSGAVPPPWSVSKLLINMCFVPLLRSDQLSSSVELVNEKMTTSECKECPCLRVFSVKPLAAAEAEQALTAGQGVLFLLWFSTHSRKIPEATLR